MSIDSNASRLASGASGSMHPAAPMAEARTGDVASGAHTLAVGDAYRLLLVENPSPAFLFDPATLRILAANDAAAEFYGFSSQELLSLTIRDLRPCEDLAGLDRALRTDLSTARRLGRWRHRRKDGRIVLVEVEVGPVVFDGAPARLVQLREPITCHESAAIGERRHLALLHNAPDAIVGIDDDARITEFNPAAERLFGYSADEIVGRDLAETLIPKEMRGHFRQGFANFLATGERQIVGGTHEVPALRADGSQVMIEMTVSESPSDARHHAFVAMIREVTEERRLEAHLCAELGVARALAGVTRFEGVTEELLRTLCECTGWDLGAVWRLDEMAGVLRLVDVWTSEPERLGPFVALTRGTAFTRDTGLAGRAWTRQEMTWVGDLGHADPRMAHCHAAGRFGLRTVVACPIVFEGTLLAVIELFSFADRRPDPAFSELMESISSQIAQFLARVREHEGVREANERFEALLDASPLAVFLFDINMTVRYWNRAAERIFGWTQEEMIGHSYLRVVPAERRGETRRLQEAVLRGERIMGVYATRHRKDGSVVNVILNGAPIHDERGRVTGIVGLIAEEWDRTDA